MKVLETTIVNGRKLVKHTNGLWVDGEGDSGYHAPLTGTWVCYYCGNLCECGENK